MATKTLDVPITVLRDRYNVCVEMGIHGYYAKVYYAPHLDKGCFEIRPSNNPGEVVVVDQGNHYIYGKYVGLRHSVRKIHDLDPDFMDAFNILTDHIMRETLLGT